MSLLVHILQAANLWDDGEHGFAIVEVSMGAIKRSTHVLHSAGKWRIDRQFHFALEKGGENVLKVFCWS